ncbi:MAG: PAS domain-containing protein, partial [Candidatus Sericytochromatia bacterium]
MSPSPHLVAVAPTDLTYDRLKAAAPGAPLERLDHLATLDRAQGEAADAVVFELGEAEAHPMAMITEAPARPPFAQIVFVGPAGALARARQTLLLVGGLTDQRTFLQADQPDTWPQALLEAHDRAQRRRQLKAAIAPAASTPQATPLDADAPMPHLAGVLTHMQEAVLFLDLKGQITYANPAAERLYGRGADALRGTPLSALAPPESREDQDRLLASVRDGGPGGSALIAHRAPGGEPVTLEVSVSPVRDWRGQLAGITLLARDV